MKKSKSFLFHLNANQTKLACVVNNQIESELGKRANTLLSLFAEAFSTTIAEMNVKAMHTEIVACFLQFLVEDFPYLHYELPVWKKMINRKDGFIRDRLMDFTRNQFDSHYFHLKRVVEPRYREQYPKINHAPPKLLHLFHPRDSHVHTALPLRINQLSFEIFSEVLFQSMKEAFPGITQSKLKSRNREQNLAFKRIIVFYLCRFVYKKSLSFENIGILVDRKHCTVLSGLRRHARLMSMNTKQAHIYQLQVSRINAIFFKGLEQALLLNQKISFDEGLQIVLGSCVSREGDEMKKRIQEIAMKQESFPRGFFLHMADEKKTK